MPGMEKTAERKRLLENAARTTYWRKWGPYVSERQWGTVREDYSDNGDAWGYLVHDQARSRAYRWSEDGLAGICDDRQYLCFALALWNEKDPILKERLFGLTNSEGNHGEDVKEYYFYIDNTPTHSYMRYGYKYPYLYPYAALTRDVNKIAPFEYELMDTGAFQNDAYFDVEVEYAKNAPNDILVRITVANKGAEQKTLRVLPVLWFRNTWSWGDPGIVPPSIRNDDAARCLRGSEIVSASGTQVLPAMRLFYSGQPETLFTNNETNKRRLFAVDNESPYVKDAINDYIVSQGERGLLNPAKVGSKAALHFMVPLAPKETRVLTLRLADQDLSDPLGPSFGAIFERRKREADEFYSMLSPHKPDSDEFLIQRQAFAGMLWSKQFYHYDVERWQDGDLTPAPSGHQNGRNKNWNHMYAKDILSMPDKWEYPWFAAWDLAFHTVTLAMIDPEFAKNQLLLLVMEWYMHPNGQMPAFEYDFNAINPPVHAWAAWEVFETERRIYGKGDRGFLERVFHKLNMNFTWWVNKIDDRENNVFEGGFLGLDNIRIFDKDADGNRIEQADGTAWMAMYCLNMFKIATELALTCQDFNDLARKYFQHFLYIARAINPKDGSGLWDNAAGFFMDKAHKYGRLQVFSLVGLIPLFATEEIEIRVGGDNSFFDLEGSIRWFVRNRMDLVANATVAEMIANYRPGDPTMKGILSLVSHDSGQLGRILGRMLSSEEFLSEFGIRALSKRHEKENQVRIGDKDYAIDYEPAESNKVKMMGGNSNWRGPIWMPVNFLLVRALRKLHLLNPGFTIDFPSASGNKLNLDQVADRLSERLIAIFKRNGGGKRPVFGGVDKLQNDWNSTLLFNEYFHGDNGAGLGASHQTGWTGLIANILQEMGEKKPG